MQATAPDRPTVLVAVQLLYDTDAEHAADFAELRRLVHTLGYEMIATVSPEAFDGPRLHVLAPGAARAPAEPARALTLRLLREWSGLARSLARLHDGVLHACAISLLGVSAFPCGIELGDEISGDPLHHAVAIAPDGSYALLRSSSRVGSRLRVAPRSAPRAAAERVVAMQMAAILPRSIAINLAKSIVFSPVQGLVSLGESNPAGEKAGVPPSDSRENHVRSW